MSALLIFDGECGFCTSAARWAQRSWSSDAKTVPWQRLGESDLRQLGLTEAEAGSTAWWVDRGGRLYAGHQAVAHALIEGGGWRRSAGWASLTPPVSWLAAGVYRLVTRWRHRLPGGTPACRA